MTTTCDCATCVAYVLAANNERTRVLAAVDAVATAHEKMSREYPRGYDKIKAEAIRRFGELFL